MPNNVSRSSMVLGDLQQVSGEVSRVLEGDLDPRRPLRQHATDLLSRMPPSNTTPQQNLCLCLCLSLCTSCACVCVCAFACACACACPHRKRTARSRNDARNRSSMRLTRDVVTCYGVAQAKATMTSYDSYCKGLLNLVGRAAGSLEARLW